MGSLPKESGTVWNPCLAGAHNGQHLLPLATGMLLQEPQTRMLSPARRWQCSCMESICTAALFYGDPELFLVVKPAS